MITLIGGIPCSGKSTLMRGLLSRLSKPKLIEPMPLFKCQEHDDILVLGQYPEGETFGGTDKLSHGSIPKFREFITMVQPKYKHILIEGDRYFRGQDIEWLVDNYDANVYVLTCDFEIEEQRHKDRGDTQSEVWLKGRRSQINNILTNMNLMGKIEVIKNNSSEDRRNLEYRIYESL